MQPARHHDAFEKNITTLRDIEDSITFLIYSVVVTAQKVGWIYA